MIPAFERSWAWGLLGDAEAATIWSPERQLAHMIAFEAAYVRALGAAGLLEGSAAERLATAVERVALDPATLQAGARRDGVPVVALVEAIRSAIAGAGGAGPSPGAVTREEAMRVHAGATSQDVVDTALALVLGETTTLVERRLRALIERLDALESRFGERSMTGRTRMQAARPIAVSVRLAAWRDPLRHHLDDLPRLRTRVERLQLGGAVGDRAAWGEAGDDVAAHLAASLGLGAPPRAWHATREGVVEYGAAIARIAGTLGKLGQDVALMAQQGVDEVRLSGGGESSAMPHKRNPIEAETLVALARFAATQAGGLHQALVHEQERSGAAWTLEWLILPQIATACARALATAAELLGRVEDLGSR